MAAAAEFYRLHGRVVLAQILLVVAERALGEEVLRDKPGSASPKSPGCSRPVSWSNSQS
jgi:hypothetical protein